MAAAADRAGVDRLRRPRVPMGAGARARGDGRSPRVASASPGWRRSSPSWRSWPTRRLRTPDWWFDPARGGGWLGASGSHVDRPGARLVGRGRRRARRGVDDVGARREGCRGRLVHHAPRYDLGRARVVVQQTAGAWGPMVDVARVAGTEGTLWIEAGQVWVGRRRPAWSASPCPRISSCHLRHRRAPIPASASPTSSWAPTPGWPRRSRRGSAASRRRRPWRRDLRRRAGAAWRCSTAAVPPASPAHLERPGRGRAVGSGWSAAHGAQHPLHLVLALEQQAPDGGHVDARRELGVGAATTSFGGRDRRRVHGAREA